MPRLSTLAVAIAALAAALVTATSAFAAPAAPAAAPAAPAPITPEARAAGMKAAPALIAAAQLPCTLAAAASIGTGKDPKGQPLTLTEISCSGGMGYIIAADAKGQPNQVFDCLMAATINLPCRLPEDAHPEAGLQSLVQQSGRDCTVDKARFMGLTDGGQKHIYEVACSNGTGLVLITTSTGGSPTADNCLAYADQANGCTLTTHDQEMAEAKAIEASAGKCTVAKDRYMITAADGSDYFEIACSDGKGYVLQADKTGKLAQAIPCTEAYQIGDGCTLTDTKQAETQEASTYSGLAKNAGFDCQVSKYALFPQSDATKDIVELVCSNRPDGGVGVFPARGAGEVYDCVRSQDEGYKCTFTPESAVYPHLSAALRAAGKGSCVVSDARPFAHGDDGSDYVEVGCADGGSGWVMIYPPMSPTPKQLMNCAQAKDMNGGCQLPGNKKG